VVAVAVAVLLRGVRPAGETAPAEPTEAAELECV
jgi:hypothetical protein